MNKYFKPEEFKCRCGCGFCDPTPLLLDVLDKIRKNVGRPINVTSGCRCETHNKRVGGVKDSNHTKGYAADIQCRGVAASRFWRIIRDMYSAGELPELAGLGRYDTFVS